MSRRESVGRLTQRTQSASGPPGQQLVSVAVLPPRLPLDMAPPTGIGAAETFDWDESLNWRHNESIEDKVPEGQKTSFRRRIGLTTYRKPANEDLPPFVLRQVTYDTWRKHYAKDKDGNYHGTHAPAEDCLLKPEDVQRWRLGPPRTKADQWTRGSEALPVYEEAANEGNAPEYEADYTGPPRSEPVLDDNGEMKKMPTNASVSSTGSNSARGSIEAPVMASTSAAPAATTKPATGAVRPMDVKTGKIISQGKTAEQIIAEAKQKQGPKLTWKQKLQKGGEMVSMGFN